MLSDDREAPPKALILFQFYDSIRRSFFKPAIWNGAFSKRTATFSSPSANTPEMPRKHLRAKMKVSKDSPGIRGSHQGRRNGGPKLQDTPPPNPWSFFSLPNNVKPLKILAMTEISIEVPNEALRSSDDQLTQAIQEAAVLQLYLAGRLSSERAARLLSLSGSDFLEVAGDQTPAEQPLGLPPTPMESLQGSRYLARVLWALSEGRKRSLTPMTATDIAKFVTANSDVTIQQTNTARFFRECRKSGRFEQYWTVSSQGTRTCYSITEQGEKLLTGEPQPNP